MKITPVAGPNIAGSVSTSSGPSNDRVAAAKAAFMGQDPATIQPQQQPQHQQDMNVKRIKMRTQHSPETYLPEVEQQNNPESSISGDNEQGNTPDVRKPISPQVAALAKERRQLQVMKQELLAKEKALAEKESSGQSVSLESFKSNWLDILLNSGMSYEQLIEQVASKGAGADPSIEYNKKIKELEEKFNKTLTDRDSLAEQQVLQELRRDANRITAQGDEFEAIRANRAQGKVVEFIEKQYRKTGELLDTYEAAQIIENILIDDALKAAGLNKVKSRLAPTPQTQVQPQQQAQQLKTLTNRQTANPPMSRKQRAMAAFHGRLK